MTIYFLRHASAGKSLANAARDEKRPLDKEGVEQCSYVGRLLASLDVVPDAIISSPLKRATQTAALVGNELGYDDKIMQTPALRPGATYEAFRDMLRTVAQADTIFVVGHNPNLSEFLSQTLTSGGSKHVADLKKGAVAKVSVAGKKSMLEWLITPKIARTTQPARQTKERLKTSLK